MMLSRPLARSSALCTLFSAASSGLRPKLYIPCSKKFHNFPEISRKNASFLGGIERNWDGKLSSATHLQIDHVPARCYSLEMEDADFGDLSVQRVTEADFDDMMTFLRADFLHNEPLNRSLNMTVEDSKGLFDDLVHAGIASSLSYALRAPDGQVAAVRLVSIMDRPEKEQPSKDNGAPPWNNSAVNENNNAITTTTGKLTPNAQMVMKLLEEVENKIWILVNPRLKRLLLWSIISVGKNFTRRGLAGKLLNYNLDEAKLMGCQGCVAEATAFKSQRLFKKLGYEAIHELKHDEWLDENGKQIFKCDDSTNSIQLVFKPL